MDSTQKLVIGAGMVGSCCALYLQRAGHSVTLVDSHPPGSQTSYGNAAAIAPRVILICLPRVVPLFNLAQVTIDLSEFLMQHIFRTLETVP